MRFRVISNNAKFPGEARSVGYLLEDNWNDWFKFKTLYVLRYYDSLGVAHDLGGVKFGQFSMAEHQQRPELPATFEQLDGRFFSLGQDVDYYDMLGKLEDGKLILSALNDISANDELYLRARQEPVTGVSLMRSVNEHTIKNQFRRILNGGARLTAYAFSYRGPDQIDIRSEPVVLDFEIEPYSKPPTNIQVIIGRNGVGKSHLLNAMARALVSKKNNINDNGEFTNQDGHMDSESSTPFANIVSVSFSAFDDFPIIRSARNATDAIRYTNVGLRKRTHASDGNQSSTSSTITQSPEALTTSFISSVKACTTGEERRERWLRALRTLESDPVFEEADVTALLRIDIDDLGKPSGRLFRNLSSGHKIVLLTITKLVECVEERTLVLMDEPEAHLHPPLLSAFIRALSDLLINRNGVAIVATHSPVVVQEVPKRCVWKLRRHGGNAVAERPQIETFAENVGRLTHEVFGLEVTKSGFHKTITEAIEPTENLDDVLAKFDREVGLEGRALISARIAELNADNSEDDL